MHHSEIRTYCKYTFSKISANVISLCDVGIEYDFLSAENNEWKGHIVTNPPYKYAKEFIEKAISIIPEGCLVAMFLPIRYTEGKARKKLFQAHPPKTVYISSSRLYLLT